jgi:hypothetical protein
MSKNNSYDKYQLIAALYNHAEPHSLPQITPEIAREVTDELEDDNGFAILKNVRGKELGFSVFSDRLFDTEDYERQHGPISQVLATLSPR